MSEPSTGAETRTLVWDDFPAFLELRWLAFQGGGDPDDPAYRARFEARLPVTRGRFVDGRLVSCASWYRFGSWLAGRRIVVAGLGGVMTAPEARRRGHVEALLADGLETLAEEGIGWSSEHPFDPRFYARYGWQSVPSGGALDLPLDRLPSGGPPDAVRLGRADPERLGPIHTPFARRWQLALSRDDDARDHWGFLSRAPWDPAPNLVFLVEDGYLIGEVDTTGARPTLHLRDLAWSSAAGRRRLLELIGSYRSQVERVDLQLPPGDPLLADWGSTHPRTRSGVQARVVALDAALRPFRAPQPQTLQLRVHDPFAPWNDGVWRFDLSPDGCRAERCAGDAATTADVRALPLLLLGASDPQSVRDAGLAEGDPAPLEALAALAGGRRPFLIRGDHF